jgi:hypothetical protein
MFSCAQYVRIYSMYMKTYNHDAVSSQDIREEAICQVMTTRDTHAHLIGSIRHCARCCVNVLRRNLKPPT